MAKHGTFTWADLTIPNAEEVRDFYAAVVGWQVTNIDMDGYQDFAMTTADGDGAVGICHARGGNADIPPVWMVYINVDDLDAALVQVEANGGTLATPIKGEPGGMRYAAIKDPAGAVLTLIENAEADNVEVEGGGS